MYSLETSPHYSPYVIDLTAEESSSSCSARSSEDSLDEKPSASRQRKYSRPSPRTTPVPVTASNLQLFTRDVPHKAQFTIRRKPVSPLPLDAHFSALDVNIAEASVASTLPPESFAKYMSAYADQSVHVHFNVPPRTIPTSRPGTSKSWRAPPSTTSLPTRRQLEHAAALPIIGQRGERMPFGELWRKQKTIVIFIRHFLCPLCQDYMASVTRTVSPEILKRAGVKLVIVGNGSHKLIKSYRKIFRTPFQVYTDPTHQIYDTLQMKSEITGNPGAPCGYVRHGMLGGIAMVVGNALKVGMPLWENGGDISRLGGEFILGPGITCSFAHRMHNPRSHVPIARLITEAGVDVATPVQRSPTPTSKPRNMTEEEEKLWMRNRRRSLVALNARKIQRRGGKQWCGGSKLVNIDSKEST
ncbi:hypothetical protein ONZ45_g8722 [Pleurotus djamor]|nr:hypothetical protein ONZ45_g8722 [Pleurotus djamor]